MSYLDGSVFQINGDLYKYIGSNNNEIILESISETIQKVKRISIEEALKYKAFSFFPITNKI